jgi:protein TonB
MFTGLPRGAAGGVGAGNGLMPLLQITPVYPHTAEIQGREGQVTVEFTIMTDGAVADARVLSSTHPVFEKAALDAAMRSRYQPQFIGGTPVAVSGVRMTFDFQLRN